MTDWKEYLGDRDYYRTLMGVALPIAIQMGTTNFVNMLDNVMIGQVGTLPMSGVSITNQLIVIFNLAIFGSVAAVGIFGAQYFGRGNHKGVRDCLHMKLIITGLCCLIAGLVFGLFGKDLILLYLENGSNSAEDIQLTLQYGWSYLQIMMIGLVPFALTQAVTSTLKEGGETVLSMAASLAAVLINLVFNYILIFGHFGFPKLGITGAAIATVFSRFVELFIVLIGIMLNLQRKYAYLKGITKDLKIPAELTGQVLRRGTPLVVNEILWSGGLAMISQCYSLRGLTAVAAINITTTVTNVFLIVSQSMGHAISILVGQKLGAGKTKEAMKLDLQLILSAFFFCCGTGIALYAVAPFFPLLYNTSEEVRGLATRLLQITAFMMPVTAIYMSSYFTLRSGGKTIITFLFDSAYTCCINFTIAFLLAHFTSLPVLFIFLCVQAVDIPKAVLGLYLVLKGVWIQVLVV